MLKNVSSNWIRMLVGICVVFLLTPFLYERLGEAGYGQWSLINTFVGNLALLILGIPMASVHFMTGAVARRDAASLNRAISTCLGVYLWLGLLALLVGGGLYFWYSAGYPIPDALRDDAELAFLIMVVGSAVGFAMQLPYGVIVAHHDFTIYNAVLILGMLLRFGLTMALMSATNSMPLLAAIPVLTTAFEAVVALVIIKKRYPAARMSLSSFDRATVRTIFGFSAFVLLINLGTRLAFQVNGMVVGAHMSAENVGWYSVANQFMVYLMEIILGIANVVMPLAAKLHAEGREGELAPIFLRWSKASFNIVLAVGLWLVMLGPEFLGWWMGPEVEGPAGRALQILTASFIIYLPLRGVAMPAVNGLGDIRTSSWMLVGMGVVNLGLSLALVGPMGLDGVALGTAIPNVLFALAMLVIACRRLKVGLGAWLRYAIVKPLLAAIPMLLLLAWFKWDIGARGFWPLLFSGLAHLGLFAVLECVFVYKNDPWFDPWTRLLAGPKR